MSAACLRPGSFQRDGLSERPQPPRGRKHELRHRVSLRLVDASAKKSTDRTTERDAGRSTQEESHRPFSEPGPLSHGAPLVLLLTLSESPLFSQNRGIPILGP